MSTLIGLVHPGEMGTAVGKALVAAGRRVAWASAGRSGPTVRRADAAGLLDLGTLPALAEQCDVVVSVCPPHAALDVAAQFRGFPGVYVDANAISPAESLAVAEVVGSAARFVDGSIIGGPPPESGGARLYLAGAAAEGVAELFAGDGASRVGSFRIVVLPGDVPAASALKMTYAAWTKISSALLLATSAAAEQLHVADALTDEWANSQPQLAQRLQRARRSAELKGWRWVGEMEQIAATFAALGLPSGFGEAAARMYSDFDPPEPDLD